MHVRKGDRVRAGDLLLTFDLDLLARKAPSLMTPVIVTNGERFRIRNANLNRVVARGDVLFELEEIARRRTAASRASRRAGGQRSAWWSRTRMASTRGPRR